MPENTSPPVTPAETLNHVPHQSTQLHTIAIVVAALTVIAAGAGVLFWTGLVSAPSASAREPKRIGIIQIPQVLEAGEGFRAKLAELGYDNVEYDDRVIVISPTLGDDARKAAQEFLDNGVNLIYTDFEAQAKVAQAVTEESGRTDVPIVFISRLHDPVTMGLVDSFQTSGNNLTGVATNILELVQRHMQYIKDINPNAKKLGVFGKGFQVPAVAEEYYNEVKKVAPQFGLQIVEYTTDVAPPEAKAAFDRIAATIKKGDIDAMMHIAGHYYETQEAGESELAIRLGIPMATNYEDIPRGGHFTLSNGTRESGEQAAVMADKIFRGTKPSDIPIEYAQKDILSLHLGRARAAGFTFPESMLYLATNKYEDDSAFPPIVDK